MTKQERIDEANKVLAACAAFGRRFFSDLSDKPGRESMTPTRVAHFMTDDRGRLWYIDSYRGARVNTVEAGFGYSFGRGFTNGGTLRELCRALARYIRTGEPVSAGHFGPWRQECADGDLWGYGEDMAKLRAEVAQLAAVAPRKAGIA